MTEGLREKITSLPTEGDPLRVKELNQKGVVRKGVLQLETCQPCPVRYASWCAKCDKKGTEFVLKEDVESLLVEVLQVYYFDFRENELKRILDEIERGCFKTQKEVLFEVIRSFDEVIKRKR